MVRRVLSLVRGGGARLAALDLNAFALAEDVELTIALLGSSVESALASPDVSDDVNALIASGVRVIVTGEDLSTRGLAATDLADGIETITSDDLALLTLEHEVTLTW